MALRNQPYIPLYVNDFLSDEKLRECSASSVGVYIFIMCLMHKSETYGKILLKQKFKQIGSKYYSKFEANNEASSEGGLKVCYNFASALAGGLPFEIEVIAHSLHELISENVLILDGDYLIQKRMVKDNKTSEGRAIGGQAGGLKTIANYRAKIGNKFAQAKSEASSEDAIEYKDNQVVLDLRGEGEEGENRSFENEAQQKFLVKEMQKNYYERNPKNLKDEDADGHACLKISKKIEEANDWKKGSALNGKMEDCLLVWDDILEAVGKDNFYQTFSIKSLASQIQDVWTKCYLKNKKSINKKVLIKDEFEVEDVNIRGKKFYTDFLNGEFENGIKFHVADGEVWEKARRGTLKANEVWLGMKGLTKFKD